MAEVNREARGALRIHRLHRWKRVGIDSRVVGLRVMVGGVAVGRLCKLRRDQIGSLGSGGSCTERRDSRCRRVTVVPSAKVAVAVAL